MRYENLKDEYAKLWSTMAPTNKELLNDATNEAKYIIEHKATYKLVEDITGTPWWIVGLLHQLECSGDFKAHLHNGDPIKKPTFNFPPNRPSREWRSPPGTWVDSAVDAIQYDDLDSEENWSITKVLFWCEKYNGFNYRIKHHINTPYLWSGTNHYTKGKRIRDGVYDPDAVSKQVGVALLLDQVLKLCPTIKVPDVS